MPVVERPLTVIERVLHAVYRHKGGDGTPIFAIRCSGPWDEDGFRAALAAVQAGHPLLRARIVERRSHWPVFQFLDSAPPIPLEIRSSASLTDWAAVAQRHAQMPLDAGHAPLVHMTALPAADDSGFDLVASFHHAIIDAKSVVALVREILGHMAGRDFDSRACVEETTFRPMRRPSIWYLARQALKLIQMQFRQAISRPTLVPDEIPFPGACLRHVGTAQWTAALIEQCRVHGTTVYGALAAATVLGLADHQRWKSVSVQLMVPFDIRDGYVNPIDDRTVGCFAGILDFWRNNPAAVPFWELARQCVAEIAHERRWWMPNCWDHLMSRVAFTPAWLKPLRRMAIGINNLGKCPEVAAGPWRLEELSWFGRSEHLGGTVTVNAATVNGRLNLTLQGSRLTRNTLEEIRDAILLRLDRAAGVRSEQPARRAA
jgi:hypothetical protein